MKLNNNDWNILKNQLNNRSKRRATVLYNITNELNSNYNNIDDKRREKLNNLQYKLMDEFELIHNIKYVDDNYFLDLFIKKYKYYIKKPYEISNMQYDYYDSPSYVDFDDINTENDDFIDQF